MTWYISYLESNPNYTLLDKRVPYRYNLPFYYKQDFIDIQYKVVNAYLNEPEKYQSQINRYNYIINGTMPPIRKGDYNRIPNMIHWWWQSHKLLRWPDHNKMAG